MFLIFLWSVKDSIDFAKTVCTLVVPGVDTLNVYSGSGLQLIFTKPDNIGKAFCVSDAIPYFLFKHCGFMQ